MEHIKNRLWEIFGNNFYKKIKESFSDYTVSLTAIVVTSVYCAFLSAMQIEFDTAVFETARRGLIWFCFGAVFAETYFAERKKRKICALTAAAVIAVPLAIGPGLDAETRIWNISGGVLAELTERFLYGYMLLLHLLMLLMPMTVTDF